MVTAVIVGAAGYAGVELTRLLLGHPEIHLSAVTSAADAGRRVDELYPALTGCDLVYTSPRPEDISAADVAFLAVPHTAALALVPGLLATGTTVIDLSADFRLRDATLYERWYDAVHSAPALLGEAVYGLPELWRDRLPGARLVACPGCYPTATLLAAAPAIEADIIRSARVIVDAKSGVSGAGRGLSPATHYVRANESVSAYKAGVHRHTPEIAQGLGDLGLAGPALTFVPHLVPMTRGLLSTVYLDVVAGISSADAVAVYREHYASERFVRVHDVGTMPTTAEVSGTNRAHLGVAVDAHGTLIVTCAIDNLVKGAAGQAVQCANLALGLEESSGLAGYGPVV